MPELPEVETVKRILEPKVTGLKITNVTLIYENLVKSNKEEFLKNLPGATILNLDRVGKHLIFNLDNNYSLVVHFRMEGKFFNLDTLEGNILPSTSLYFDLSNGTYLLFNDTRKFGVMYLVKTNELMTSKPLNDVGKEPWDIDEARYLYDRYTKSNKYIKELLLDQTIMCGLGNIYADEVLFKSGISPFKRGKELTYEECERILKYSEETLKEAIEQGGSTIKSYHPSKGVNGNFQHSLLVYGRENKTCYNCKSKIFKRYVGGRGTHFCPKCQHVASTIGIVGKIASGKSAVLQILKNEGILTISSDEIVRELYSNVTFLKDTEKKFKELFINGEVDKRLITEKLIEDKKFKRSYETHVFKYVRQRVNDFLVEHADEIVAVEVPLLFEAHMEHMFTYLVGVESSREDEFLRSREGKNYEIKKSLNASSKYEFNKDKLDEIIENDGSLAELEIKVKKLIDKVKSL